MSQKTALAVFSPAKVNLHLAVGGKRDDGYHDLESLFLALNFGDTLHFEASSIPNSLEINMDDDNTIPIEKNIIFKAVKLYREETGFPDGLKIRVEKRIPMGGGLGGGSSNAAATLLALRTLRPLRLEKIMKIGEALGSDVPFFLHQTAAAWVTGRGEHIKPIDVQPMFLVLVNPGFPSNTAEAFRLLDEKRLVMNSHGAHGELPFGKPSCPKDSRTRRKNNGRMNSTFFYNDFLEVFPEPQKSTYKKILSLLIEREATYANLSGSGSTCFGVFEDAVQAKQAAESLRGQWPFVQECMNLK